MFHLYNTEITKTLHLFTPLWGMIEKDDNPVWKATHAVPNAERRFKRRVGYYSPPMKWYRLIK
jgi:hypothetical protein